LPDGGWLILEVLAVWLAISLRGLAEHGTAVSTALRAGDLSQAREQVGRIVSRNAEALDERGVAAAASESMLENGADAVLGQTSQAWRCWQTQAKAWDSPNAGPVMAAGAGALGVTLGGPAPYAGGTKQRPVLGCGPAPGAQTIEASIQLVRRGAWLWVIVLMVGAGLGRVLMLGGA